MLTGRARVGGPVQLRPRRRDLNRAPLKTRAGTPGKSRSRSVLFVAQHHRRRSPLALTSPATVTSLPTSYIVRVAQPTPFQVALERALSRPMEPWWGHWLHIGRR